MVTTDENYKQDPDQLNLEKCLATDYFVEKVNINTLNNIWKNISEICQD